MKIVTIPHPSLSVVCKPVAKIDKRILKLIKDMEKTLDKQHNPEGVGLSAPQVGIEERFFIIKHPETKKRYTMINPVFKEQTDFMDSDLDDENLEGCLSIPEIWAPVQRYRRVQVQYLDKEGKECLEWFDGFLSIVVQHEYDHLDGILFTQRALEQGNPIYKESNGKLREVEYI